MRLIAHQDLPEGFSLYEEGGTTRFPVYADGMMRTYPVSYIVKPGQYWCFRINQSVKSALAEFQRHLEKA